MKRWIGCLFSVGAGFFFSMGMARANVVMCPGNVTFVSTGDSVEQVLKSCGEPISHYEKEVDTDGSQAQPSGALHWYYSNAYAGNNLSQSKIINFQNGRISSIQNGVSTVSSLQCRGGLVQIGDDMSAVSQRCGLPQTQASDGDLKQIGSRLGPRADAQIRQERVSTLSQVSPFSTATTSSQNAFPLKGKHTLLVLIYQPQSYMPKTAFMFVDGHLASTGRVASEAPH